MVSWRRSLSVPCQASDTSTLESCHLWDTRTLGSGHKYIRCVTLVHQRLDYYTSGVPGLGLDDTCQKIHLSVICQLLLVVAESQGQRSSLLSLNQVLPRSSKDHVGITVSVFTSDPQPLSIHTGCIQFRIATFLVFSQAIGETSSTAKTVYSARQ